MEIAGGDDIHLVASRKSEPVKRGKCFPGMAAVGTGILIVAVLRVNVPGCFIPGHNVVSQYQPKNKQQEERAVVFHIRQKNRKNSGSVHDYFLLCNAPENCLSF